MAVTLYAHNQTAYRNAMELLEESGRAAVVHPTGTGKSFIAFKLAEDHPGKRILWLAPGEYIFRTQRENYLKAGGDGAALSDITFLTYSKLLYAMQETDGEASEISLPAGMETPDYIILDEFHRCGAAGWGDCVERLLRRFPDAGVLGLSATNIRYLDNRRDMAEELFAGRIASRMELTEAMREGILPVPLYVCGIYEYGKELKRLSARVCGRRGAGAHGKSAELLGRLRRSLAHARGPAEIFAAYMKRDGKYIVFCSDRRQMAEACARTGEWYGALDPEPHVYRAVYDSPESPEEVRRFAADGSGHLKLLFCIDMLNEGVHIGDVDGAVLLRATSSPTLYLQQIGRALSVRAGDGKGQPVIFDLADNFDSLRSIDSFMEAYRRADDAKAGERERVFPEFRLIDEARESRELFERLRASLAADWETCFAAAEKYYALHGNLRIPKRYVTEDGISLGSWLATQRRVRAGDVPGRLTAEQTERLDGIGMEWGSRAGKAWETGYGELVLYLEEKGDCDVPTGYVTADGYPLGRFVSNQRAAGKRGVLTQERRRRLDAAGFIWEASEPDREKYLAAARAFYEREGHLRVPVNYVTENGLHLGRWLDGCAARRESLSPELRRRLEETGMTWEGRREADWEERFRLAEAYFLEHGNLEIPADYTVQGIRLGKWIAAQRSAGLHPEGGHYRPDAERIKRLDAIGMRWGGEEWERRYRLAESWFLAHGNLRPPQNYVVETDGGGIWLGKWVAAQRRKHNSPGGRRALTEEQERRLEAIGMEW